MNIDSAPSRPSPTLLIHQTDLMLFQHTTAYLPQIGPRNTILPTYLIFKWEVTSIKGMYMYVILSRNISERL